MAFNGLGMSLGNLTRLSTAESRSISAENPKGERGKGGMADPDPNGPARELGRGWKCRPFINLEAGETVTLADIDGPGAIQSMWFGGFVRRDFILRIYWDNQAYPSVEVPLCDFFGANWFEQSEFGCCGPLQTLNSLPVCINPNRSLNCFWEMPFRKHCRITLENRHPKEKLVCYYQINYTLTDVSDDAAYFHAQYRRVESVQFGKTYMNLDGIKGQWTLLRNRPWAWALNNNGWVGPKANSKSYIDGRRASTPPSVGRGKEEYFGGLV